MTAQDMRALPRVCLRAMVKGGVPKEFLFVNASFIATVSTYGRHGQKSKVDGSQSGSL